MRVICLLRARHDAGMRYHIVFGMPAHTQRRAIQRAVATAINEYPIIIITCYNIINLSCRHGFYAIMIIPHIILTQQRIIICAIITPYARQRAIWLSSLLRVMRCYNRRQRALPRISSYAQQWITYEISIITIVIINYGGAGALLALSSTSFSLEQARASAIRISSSSPLMLWRGAQSVAHHYQRISNRARRVHISISRYYRREVMNMLSRVAVLSRHIIFASATAAGAAAARAQHYAMRHIPTARRTIKNNVTWYGALPPESGEYQSSSSRIPHAIHGREE